MPHLNLRHLIIALTFGAAIFTLTTSFWASSEAQKTILINGSLEANRLYAVKITGSVADFLGTVQKQLHYASSEISKTPNEQALINDELLRLLNYSGTFNSVRVVDATGHLIGKESRLMESGDRYIDLPESKAALAAKEPIITDPHIDSSGHLVITMSHPINKPNGDYVGYISGSIYLEEKNVLSSLFGEHDFRDGSYIYVIGDDRRIIYHRDAARIGDIAPTNPAIEDALSGNTNSASIVNSRGDTVLAGYSFVPAANWGVIVQQPMDATLASMNTLAWKTFCFTLPALLIALVIIWQLSGLISRPLFQLASNARRMIHSETDQALTSLNAWYFEAAQFKKELLLSHNEIGLKLKRLHEESHSDHLTGLANRRAMTTALSNFNSRKIPFSMIILDVDHFKQINDAFGHDIGDVVLQQVADIMRRNSRPHDLLCRLGGEEFAIFLPDSSISFGHDIAERIRSAVEGFTFIKDMRLTISAGVAHVPGTSPVIKDALKAADVALYAAKSRGRNRVTIAD